MRIATRNVNSLCVPLPQVLEWLARAPRHVPAMQETKLTDPDFPHAELVALGYHAPFAGQKTYNGVALPSRVPGTALLTDTGCHIDREPRPCRTPVRARRGDRRIRAAP